MKANASQAGLSFVPEVTWGTTPGSPAMKYFRHTGFSLNLKKTALKSGEMREDGQTPFLRHGMKMPDGSVDAEATYAAYKQWIRAALRYSLSAGDFVSSAGTGTTFTSGTKTIGRSTGSFITDGAVAGQMIRTTGATNTANNGVWTIVSVAALAIVVAESGFVTETASANVKINGYHASNGVVESSFSVEARYTDIAQYEVFTGVMVNALRMSAAPSAIPTIGFDLLAKNATITGASLGTPTDVDTAEPCDTYNGVLKIAGTDKAIVTGLDFTAAWGREGQQVLGANTVAGISANKLEVGGKMSVFWEDLTEYNRFVNETAFSLEYRMQDPTGNALIVRFPNCKYTGGEKSKGTGDIILGLPFEALRDATLGKTILMDIVPAVAV